MIKVSEKIGKTIDEAIAAALKELNVSRDEVQIEVLEEPTKGFLGLIGGKPAKVRVSFEEKSPTSLVQEIEPKGKAKSDISKSIEVVEKFLFDIAQSMGLEVKLNSVQRDDNTLEVNFSGAELGILIGRRGDTLDALQYLTNLVVNKNQEKRIRLILDVEGYRKKRESTLQNLAYRLEEKVKRRGQEVILEPMNPQERRVIHTALQNSKFVSTHSFGEEPFRKVVIAPKK